jgi:hypothetical protein
MEARQERLLRTAFALGAVTDALAVVPMLFPPMAALLWGFEEHPGPYQFAMGYGASLMLGWTGLLLWAWQKPRERSFVALLTVLVIYGLALTEVVAVLKGHVAVRHMIPTWLLQVGLLALFAGAYHYPWLARRRVAWL